MPNPIIGRAGSRANIMRSERLDFYRLKVDLLSPNEPSAQTLAPFHFPHQCRSRHRASHPLRRASGFPFGSLFRKETWERAFPPRRGSTSGVDRVSAHYPLRNLGAFGYIIPLSIELEKSRCLFQASGYYLNLSTSVDAQGCRAALNFKSHDASTQTSAAATLGPTTRPALSNRQTLNVER